MFIVESFKFLDKNFIGVKVNVINPPLLMIIGSQGVLACGYVKHDVAREESIVVIVSGVKEFDDMPKAKIVGLSRGAANAGLKIGDNGEEALKII